MSQESEMPTTDDIVKAAAKLLVDAALGMLEKDNHYYGTRPCGTCSAVSGLIGRDFGCVRLRKQKEGS